MITVIAKNEVLPFRNNPFPITVALFGSIRFIKHLTVDTDRAIGYDYPVTWQTNHAFNVIFGSVSVMMEDDNFSALGFAETVGQAIDQQVVSLVQGGAHAEINDCDPDGDGIDNHKDEHCQKNCFKQFCQQAFFLFHRRVIGLYRRVLSNLRSKLIQ